MTKNDVTAPPKGLTIALGCVAAFGVGLTLFIEASHIWPQLAEMCGVGGGGCADIDATPYAKIFGIPTAWWGMVAYVAYLGALRWAKPFVMPIAAAMMGAEFYFLWLMAAVIHIWCTFCLIQYGTVLILFGATVVWAAKLDRWILPGKLWSVPVVVILFFAGFAIPVKMKAHEGTLTTDALVTYAGDPTSKLVVEVFSDYECGHCRKFDPIAEMIAERNPGVLLVYRDFVLSGNQLSPTATSYADAIAFTQGTEAYRKERVALFENQARLYNYLEEKLPTVTFTDDLKKKIKRKVDDDMKRAEALNVYSTPTVVVSKDGKTVQLFRGGTPYDTIYEIIKQNQ